MQVFEYSIITLIKLRSILFIDSPCDCDHVRNNIFLHTVYSTTVVMSILVGTKFLK